MVCEIIFAPHHLVDAEGVVDYLKMVCVNNEKGTGS
jgi:hypothetical protein